jgi:glycosyltransferase involved in cell wall biosynthesis
MNKYIYINGKFLTQETSGVQRVAYELSAKLKDYYGDKVIVLVPKNSIKNIEYFKLFNILEVGYFKGNLWEQIDLPFFLKKAKANVLINFCNSQPIFFRSKNIVVLHDVSFTKNEKWFNWKFRIWYIFMCKITLHKNLAIFTDSHFSKNEICSYFFKVDSSKIYVSYLASFIKIPESKELKENDEKGYFLSVASYDPRKNLGLIINAFNRLYHKNKNIHLYLVGKQNKVFEKSFLTSSNPNIFFLNNVSDEELVIYYQKSLAFISSSLYEGFGLPILEALSQGTTCLVSDIPVYKEIYKENVLYFKSNEEISLSNLMESFIENKEKYFLLKQRNIDFSKEFSWNIAAIEYINVINKILNPS